MPIEVNRINRECPECKNSTMFNVDGEKYFCRNCMFELPIPKTENSKNNIGNETKESAQNVTEMPEQMDMVNDNMEKSINPVETLESLEPVAPTVDLGQV